jgi:hypothetical protein
LTTERDQSGKHPPPAATRFGVRPGPSGSIHTHSLISQLPTRANDPLIETRLPGSRPSAMKNL